MNIEEFFQSSAGKWFCHRTSHHLTFKQSKDGKSDIIIEALPADHPDVIQLCQQYNVTPSDAACGAKVSWKGTMEWDEQKHSGSTVIVCVPDSDNPDQGNLLRQINNGEKTPTKGRYKIGKDDVLTLTTEYENLLSEERLWFVSPNLRMRVSILKGLDGYTMSSFSTEIRLGGTPTTATATKTANSVSS